MVTCNITDFLSHVISSKTQTGVADTNKRGILLPKRNKAVCRYVNNARNSDCLNINTHQTDVNHFPRISNFDQHCQQLHSASLYLGNAFQCQMTQRFMPVSPQWYPSSPFQPKQNKTICLTDQRLIVIVTRPLRLLGC